MATQAQLRRIAAGLPGTAAHPRGLGFSVIGKDGKERGYAWVWKERVRPKEARVPNPKVLAILVANLAEKDVIIASDGDKFFTEPHYNGFPAVLAWVARVPVPEMRVLLTAAWRKVAAPHFVAMLDGHEPAAKPTKSRTVSARRRAGGGSRRR